MPPSTSTPAWIQWLPGLSRVRRHGLAVTASVLVTLAAPAAGCGSSAPRVVVTPMSTAQSAVFENGVDYIDDPTLLEGSWLEEWEQEIDLRVRSSDVIAFVRITTMRTDTDLEHRDTHRLSAHVDSLRHGVEPEGGELVLVVHEGDPGFDTVHNQDRRILNQRFVVFVKWVQDGDGPIEARWHMSPASERVVRRVNSLVEAHNAPVEDRRRVIVHDQPSDDEE